MKLTGMHLLVGLQPLSLSSSFAPKAVPCPHSSRLKNSLRNLVIDGPTKKPPVPKPVISQERKMTTKETANAAITEKEVRALFELWNSALATGDSRIVADRYIKKPMLLPTVSDQPRTDFDSVKDYFDAFLLKKPQGKILDGSIHIGDGWASVRNLNQLVMPLKRLTLT